MSRTQLPLVGATEKITFCRICEPLCGLVATVEDGRVTQLRPDPDHPLSRGQACPKGIAFHEIAHDPDRVLHPLRRRPDGTFEQVSWEIAMSEISARLRTIMRTHGRRSVGMYYGNPSAFSYSHALWMLGFGLALGTKHIYSVGSQDTNARLVASRLLYGSLMLLPFPDLPRTDFLLIVGANPLVSHGSALFAPRIKDQLRDIRTRGGRIVVVDPRRTETAKAHEHVAVRPDTDAWLLLSLLHVIFEEGLADEAAIARQSKGVESIRRMAARFSPEGTEDVTGVPAGTVRQLARDFATAPRATAYGRTGASLGTHATVVSALIDVLALVTGNLDRAGGTLFSQSPIPVDEIAQVAGFASYDNNRSRIGDFPDVLNAYPATNMAAEITTPGDEQLRALFVTAGNPVQSVPDGAALDAALPRLDLLVGIDLYVNDTNRHADYLLPGTTWLEREDFPIGMNGAAPLPFLQMTEAVIPPQGEARPEWEIFDEIARHTGVALFTGGPLRRLAGPLGLATRFSPISLRPRPLVEALIRIGPYGDRFGLRRGGISARVLRENPHGIVLADSAPVGLQKAVVRHRDGLVRLDEPTLLKALARVDLTHPVDPDYPLRMIGLREIRSHNSWMHNAPSLMKGRARVHAARINPADAEAAGLVDGGRVAITSKTGRIETRVLVTDEVGEGTIAVPHGWGHGGGGWRRANAAGGANSNLLASAAPSDIEPIAGMTLLNGVPVRLEAVDQV